ncbi:MBL fold metallo-hydrolase [Spirulina sp. CCNP1310]|uniref:MBL fold metallo-hydrolase n=1 Tax=Spirulina sp. CCNP1310 TaxID=3110249 RepID=UPI002B1FDB49|nr:MBL fold metallo-hydrolase [Spirulina sp. CCNP1310]MEA5418599.1 MBL fold metallo-hydrolase [Spirulina sp. CCNP1310]
MIFRQLFDPETSTYTYLIADPETKEAIFVDPVIEQVDRDWQLLQELGLTLRYCFETHIHADHITGTGKLREKTGCSGVAPKESGVVCADIGCSDGDRFTIGAITVEAIATPGHTHCDITYLVNGTHLLTGDSLFIRGCGRTDFQSGSAAALYDSITEKLFTLPDHIWVYPGHDYRGQTVSTIGEEKQYNPRLAGQSKTAFVELMGSLNLPNPKKIMEAVPANQHCGQKV